MIAPSMSAGSRPDRDQRHQPVSKSMADGSPQHYEVKGIEEGKNAETVANAANTWRIVARIRPSLPPIFSLAHLAHLSGTQWSFLRRVVGRRGQEPYRVFRIRKRLASGHKAKRRKGAISQRYRVICVPAYELLRVQTWIARRVLRSTPMHEGSVAYGVGAKIRDAAAVHAGCQWLIKTDVQNFFEAISEIQVYRVFRRLGYQPLISFELSRICTRVGRTTPARLKSHWLVQRAAHRGHVAYALSNSTENLGPDDVKLLDRLSSRGAHASWDGLPDVARLGHLPQGAPTSPMLANLATTALDQDLFAISQEAGCRYTRYADDIAFSTNRSDFNRGKCVSLIGQIYRTIARHGLSPNVSKTQIRTPGDRRIVLGLLVSGKEPRLTRKFRDSLRMHFYYIKKHGPSGHALRRGFNTVLGLRRYLEGLVGYAQQIDVALGEAYKATLKGIEWPI
jgi:RNA-directed DNA polymerase